MTIQDLILQCPILSAIFIMENLIFAVFFIYKNSKTYLFYKADKETQNKTLKKIEFDYQNIKGKYYRLLEKVEFIENKIYGEPND